jgi:hypothetical protein
VSAPPTSPDKENIATKKHAAILRPQQMSPLTAAQYSTNRAKASKKQRRRAH